VIPVRILVMTTILILSGGCLIQKKPKVAVPAPPVASIPAVSIPPPEPLSSPEPQEITPPAATPPVAVKPTPVPSTPTRPRPTPPVAPAPQTPLALGAILTPDQRKQLDDSYQSDLRQANSVLGRLNGRVLTPEQSDSVNRARTFIRQAGQYHDRDLATAAELVRRAKVLTQDLADALK